MHFFHRISDEDMAKSYAEDITAKANALLKENEDREIAFRLQILKAAIEKQMFVLFFNTPHLGVTIYAPTEKAEQAESIMRTIMAAMHIQEANEEEAYKATKNDKHPGYA